MSESTDKPKESGGASSSDSAEKREPAWWIKSVSVVFATVMAPLLVAAGMKYIDTIGTKPAPPADAKPSSNATAAADTPPATPPTVPASSSKSVSDGASTDSTGNPKKSAVGTKAAKSSTVRDSKKAAKGEPKSLFDGTGLAAFALSETDGVFSVDPTTKTLVLSASSKGDNAKLMTNEEYSNYSLIVEYQFRGTAAAEKPSGKTLRRGSVTFHSNLSDVAGESGAAMGFSCMLGEGSTGDLRDIPVAKNASSMSAEAEQVTIVNRRDKSQWSGFRFRAGAPTMALPHGTLHANYAEVVGGKNQQKNPEKAEGEWNRLELRCDHDRVTVLINDKVVNQASRLTRSSGRIGLRPSGAEIAIRKMELTPL